MEYVGNLNKLHSRLSSVAEYSLTNDIFTLDFNPLIGTTLNIEYLGEINCIKCGRKTNKSFSQGYCYPCFMSAPETEECVLRPELCRAHEGFARDMGFAATHCLIDHFVYLARTDAVKVGVTRNTQIPTRWIDQGATEAIILARTPNRYQAGLIEQSLKKHLPDKTNWRNMLTGKVTDKRPLQEVKQFAKNVGGEILQIYFEPDNSLQSINYPLSEIPVKVVSFDLDKSHSIGGVLTGIKGQYLIFDNQNVINIRKYGGYKVKIKCSNR
ncbi:MAG: DUF2797 domain-containing protein [Bacteroidales bacterium]|nr:DUF2797 domain-containing protein [Bacteroidales bacterium]